MSILRRNFALFTKNLKIFLTVPAYLIDFAPLFRRGGRFFLSRMVHNKGPSGVGIFRLLWTA